MYWRQQQAHTHTRNMYRMNASGQANRLQTNRHRHRRCCCCCLLCTRIHPKMCIISYSCGYLFTLQLLLAPFFYSLFFFLLFYSFVWYSALVPSSSILGCFFFGSKSDDIYIYAVYVAVNQWQSRSIYTSTHTLRIRILLLLYIHYTCSAIHLTVIRFSRGFW